MKSIYSIFFVLVNFAGQGLALKHLRAHTLADPAPEKKEEAPKKDEKAPPKKGEAAPAKKDEAAPAGSSGPAPAPAASPAGSPADSPGPAAGPAMSPRAAVEEAHHQHVLSSAEHALAASKREMHEASVSHAQACHHVAVAQEDDELKEECKDKLKRHEEDLAKQKTEASATKATMKATHAAYKNAEAAKNAHDEHHKDEAHEHKEEEHKSIGDQVEELAGDTPAIPTLAPGKVSEDEEDSPKLPEKSERKCTEGGLCFDKQKEELKKEEPKHKTMKKYKDKDEGY